MVEKARRRLSVLDYVFETSSFISSSRQAFTENREEEQVATMGISTVYQILINAACLILQSAFCEI